jgi:gamma-glutamylcyclotransferase (GGCT)/AIG2-like uncharacterized protein YtfP
MFAAVGALMAAVVGVITYRRAKRREAAQWMHEIFQRFQLGPEFDEVKQIFDFQYHDVVEPLLAALVASGNAAILRSEWKACHLIDRLLNYLEHLLYLSDAGHAKRSDCYAYFGYWFDLLTEPERGALRCYLVHFNYERLARITRASKHEYILLYGSLCMDQPYHTNLGLNKSLKFVGIRSVPGVLYDLGEYPGLILGAGSVQAELYRINEISVLSILDKFEEYDHTLPNSCLCRRTTIRVPRYANRFAQRFLRPRMIDAWIYLYNHSVDNRLKVDLPSWNEYKAEKDKKIIAARHAGCSSLSEGNH